MSWKDMVGVPISKLDDDAFTRERIIMRAEHQQATAVNWLLGADHSALETTIAYEQVAIEVTASVGRSLPEPIWLPDEALA